MSSIAGFFSYARERERVRLRREDGRPAPWTLDPILQEYRFCNVFREDDRTTRWFDLNVRRRLRLSDRVLLATVIFRWFNRISTGQVLLRAGLLDDWDTAVAKRVLREVRPLVTGSYIIKTPNGMDKLEGLCWCIDQVREQEAELVKMIRGASTLELAHAILKRMPYLGSFMAYEVVTDLRRTSLLWDATDVLSWAPAGPGAARGLGRIFENNPDHWRYTSPVDQLRMLERMRSLLRLAWSNEQLWPRGWPPWEMREVEHTLCEFDKYERARLGEGTPRQRFRSRGVDQRCESCMEVPRQGRCGCTHVEEQS